MNFNDTILKITKCIKKEWKVAFLSALIIGLTTHFYIITNNFLNHDGLYNIFETQDITYLGRWFLQYACGISSYYNLPWINGILAILYISIASVLIIDFFNIKKTINIILTAGILVTFPVVAATFSYMFTADGYMLAMLLATISVYISAKNKYGFVLGIIILSFSIGIYQAYLSFAIMLCVLKIMIEILEKSKEVKKHLLVYGSLIFLGTGLYYILLKICISIKGVALSDYQGVSNLNLNFVSNIPEGIIKSYKSFIGFPVNTKMFSANILVIFAQVLSGVLLIGVYVKEYIKRKIYLNIFSNVLALITILIMPLAMSIVYLISPETSYHTLMRYSWCLPYVVLIALLENIKNKNIINWIGSISIIIIIFNFIIVSNISFFNLEYKFEKTYSLCARILNRIEEYPEYDFNMPVVIIGRLNEDDYPSTDLTRDITVNIKGTEGDNSLYDQDHYKQFFENYFMVTIKILSKEDIEKVADTEEFKQMPIWPSKECTKVISDVLVVKLNNY